MFSEGLRVSRSLGAELIDSAPEPLGWNAVTTHAEVPNVVVVHHTGVKDDIGCVVRPAHWEF